MEEEGKTTAEQLVIISERLHDVSRAWSSTFMARPGEALRKIFVTLSDPGSSSAAQIVWHGRVG